MYAVVRVWPAPGGRPVDYVSDSTYWYVLGCEDGWSWDQVTRHSVRVEVVREGIAAGRVWEGGGMSNLAEFVLARVAEDEATARAVTGPEWSAATCEWWGDLGDYVGRHDPARVLAECEAKRRIVEIHPDEHGTCFACSDGDDGGCSDPECCGSGPIPMFKDWPCPTLRWLALPYADHADYRQEWKP